jgi:asparagine synthase (glutamine-hydrolysing)
VNYQRLALHDFLWAIAVARRQGRPLSAALHARVGRAARLLFQLQDAPTGRLPRYGHDDGSLVLPLSGCAYHDYRPALQAAAFLTEGVRWYPPGPWDEELLWMGGAEALRAPLAPPARGELSALDSGLHTLRGESGFAFIHCGSFRDRPGHADLLHLDLWWRGQNIARDAGTYSYNAVERWDTSFGETAQHNTVTVDGLSQMERAGRFLWLPWPRSAVLPSRAGPRKLLGCWEGAHDGYKRLAAPVLHRRALLRLAEHAWLVVDDLTSPDAHAYTLHWHLPDAEYSYQAGEQVGLQMATPAGPYYLRCGAIGAVGAPTLLRAAPDGPRGWEAPYYNGRTPALSLELTASAPCLRFWSILSPQPCELLAEAQTLVARGATWQAIVALGSGDGPLIASAILGGAEEDRL